MTACGAVRNDLALGDRHHVDILDSHASKDEALESAVVVTLLGDTLISLLRRLAQEHHSTKYR